MGRIKLAILTISILLYNVDINAQERYTLKECVQRAIEKNISIKNSRLDLLNSSENKKTAIGNFFPSFNISGNHNWNSGLTQNITTGILENQTTQNSSVNMSVGLDIFNGLSNIRRLHRANLDVLARKYQLEDMKEDISLLVANSYLQILFNKEQLNIQESQLKVSKEEQTIANERYNSGVIPKGDLYEIEASFAKAEQNLVNAKNNYQISKMSLAQLLLFSDTEKFEISDEDYDIPKTNILERNVDDIFKKALLNRNDIKLAKTNLDIALKDQQISNSAALPSIAGYYSYNSRVIIDAPTSLKNQFDLNAGESIGLQINIPVLNGLTTRTNIKRSKINVMRSQNFLDQTKNDKTYLEREPLNKITNKRNLSAYKHKGYSQCMDTIRDKEILEESLKRKKL